MSGASNYPGGLDNEGNLPTITATSPIVPAFFNNPRDAIFSIEAFLGALPAGWPRDVNGDPVTVASRVDAVGGGLAFVSTTLTAPVDVPVNPGVFVDVMSLDLTVGLWLVVGRLAFDFAGEGSGWFGARLYDGSAAFSPLNHYGAVAVWDAWVGGVYTAAGAATVKAQAEAEGVAATVTQQRNIGGNMPGASFLAALKVG